MELSLEISSALRLLGDRAKVGQDAYEDVLRKTAQDLTVVDDSDAPKEQDFQGEALKGTDAGTLSRCHAALTTAFIECVKGSHGNAVFSATLEDLNWPAERIARVVESLDSCRQEIRSKLAYTGTYPPHIIDVDWKLDYRVRDSTGEEGGGATYLITLHTEERDGQRGKVTFSCSLSQLTHLVTHLRQASRCIQKYASNS